MGSGRLLKLGRRLALLYLLTGYVSWQLHELGHWTAAKLLGADIVLGFDRWYVSRSPASLAPVLASGPLLTLLLALLGLLLLSSRRPPFEMLGLSLSFFNPLLDLLSALTGVARSGVTLDLGSSELVWKLLLAPAFIAVLILSLKVLKGRVASSTLFGLLALTLALSLSGTVIDRIAWQGFESGNPMFSPIYGIMAPVLFADGAAFAAFALTLRRWALRHP